MATTRYFVLHAYYFWNFFSFSYSLIIPCCSIYLNSNLSRGRFFIKLWCLILPITKSNHFDSGLIRVVEWFLRVSSQFEITKRIVSLDFFFHMKMYASSIFCNRSLLPPRGGKKIMIDRCFFILMEANDRYKLIAWWGSNDIMIKREKRDGRVTFKSHDVIKNRKRIKYSGVCVINDYVEARVFLEFVAYFY